MGTLYRHTQVGRAPIVILAVVWAISLWASVRTWHLVPIAVTLLLGGILVLFSTLTVIVRDSALDVFFGPGLVRRRIPLSQVREVLTVRTPWYYGCGIRLTPFGWLWRVSGLGAVELRFDTGQRFRIGSDEPHKLADVLRQETRVT